MKNFTFLAAILLLFSSCNPEEEQIIKETNFLSELESCQVTTFSVPTWSCSELSVAMINRDLQTISSAGEEIIFRMNDDFSVVVLKNGETPEYSFTKWRHISDCCNEFELYRFNEDGEEFSMYYIVMKVTNNEVCLRADYDDTCYSY